jgi:hypothetical protein
MARAWPLRVRWNGACAELAELAMSDKSNDRWGCGAQAVMFLLILWGFQCVSRSTSETGELKRKVESLEGDLQNLRGRVDQLERK